MNDRIYKEQGQLPEIKLRTTHLSNDLIDRGPLPQQKQFGKRISVCYIANKKAPLQLDSVRYDVQVNNGVAIYNMIQAYRNQTNQPAGVEFLFSAPPNCVIIKLEAQMGDERVLALIKEKEEAKQEFKQGLLDRKFMLYSDLDEDYPDVIKVKIGNLGPQENIIISYQYIEQLQVQVNEFWRLSIDPVVNPRYNQSQQKYLNKILNINKFDYNYVQEIKVTLNMELEFIKSPTHQILIEKQDIGTIVKLNNEQQFGNNGNQDPKNTFVLIFQNKSIHDPVILITHTDNDKLENQKSCATIQFIPKFNPLQLDDAYQAYLDTHDNIYNSYEFDAKGEYIFVVDRSVSMVGKRIEKAKQAIKLFLKSLPVDSYYNIVSFGCEGKKQYQQSVRYCQNSLEQTLQELQQFKADMGGTEIANCLQQVVLNIKGIKGYSRNIFILTDGEVDSEQVLEIVSQNAKPDLRFYSLGMGNCCNQYMIEKIAFLGNGLYHIVADDEDLNEKVIDLLKDSITPYFQFFEFETNLQNQSIIVTNVLNINCIKKNTPLTVQIIFKENKLEDEENYFFNLIYYDENMRRYGLHSEIDLKQSIENDNYHKLAVGKQFQQILQNGRLKRQEYQNNNANDIYISKENIIELSITYQILSPYTAFICVVQQDDIEPKNKENALIQVQKEQQKIDSFLIQVQKEQQKEENSLIKVQKQQQKQDQQKNFIDEIYQKSNPHQQETEENVSIIDQYQTETQQQQILNLQEGCIQAQSIKFKQFINDKQKIKIKLKITTYLDLVDKFNFDGSIQESVISLIKLTKKDFKLKIPFELQLLIAALALLEIYFNEKKDSWILVFNKGVAYLKQNKIIYKQIKNELIQMLQIDQLLYKMSFIFHG